MEHRAIRPPARRTAADILDELHCASDYTRHLGRAAIGIIEDWQNDACTIPPAEAKRVLGTLLWLQQQQIAIIDELATDASRTARALA